MRTIIVQPIGICDHIVWLMRVDTVVQASEHITEGQSRGVVSSRDSSVKNSEGTFKTCMGSCQGATVNTTPRFDGSFGYSH